MRTQYTSRFRGLDGTGSVLLMVELLNPAGRLLASSQLLKDGVFFDEDE
ncbi:MAG: hypothetical protein HYY35_10935 [Deltaproteobacteria bacterium]|nr:hypothetical protein [Deltaproteobacteria bacterium]